MLTTAELRPAGRLTKPHPASPVQIGQRSVTLLRPAQDLPAGTVVVRLPVRFSVRSQAGGSYAPQGSWYLAELPGAQYVALDLVRGYL